MVADTQSQLIVRADANGAIGTGHLMRSLALAQGWKSAGGAIVFVTNCASADLLERLKRENFAVVAVENSYPHPADWETTRRVLGNYPRAWCAVDGYHFDRIFHEKIRANGNRVLAIDDTAQISFYETDAILNQNINAEKLRYDCPEDTILFLGTTYALLRDEFLERRNRQREIPVVARRILVTMGGGDFHNQTLKVIRAVKWAAIENLEVKAVVGASNPHLAALKQAIENSPADIDLIVNAENMPELMAWADICVSAAGSTCWEAAFMNLPTMLLITADNQTGIADGLNKIGFAENLGWFEQVSEENLMEKLNAILSDARRRERMSGRGGEIVDGRGRNRIVETLLSTLNA